MPTILAQVVLHTVDGLAENFCTNTFHFFGDNDGATADLLADAIEDFYDGVTGAGNSISEYLSASIVRSSDVHEVKFYTVDGGPLGSPYATKTFELTAAPLAVYRLPAEVACCLSYSATTVGGGIAARRRGRVYIGPLCSDALDGGTSRPSSSLQTDLLAAGKRLFDAAEAAEAPWVIYSRAGNSTSLVYRGWVDDACDTQRRRGLAPTARLADIF